MGKIRAFTFVNLLILGLVGDAFADQRTSKAYDDSNFTAVDIINDLKIPKTRGIVIKSRGVRRSDSEMPSAVTDVTSIPDCKVNFGPTNSLTRGVRRTEPELSVAAVASLTKPPCNNATVNTTLTLATPSIMEEKLVSEPINELKPTAQATLSKIGIEAKVGSTAINEFPVPAVPPRPPITPVVAPVNQLPEVKLSSPSRVDATATAMAYQSNKPQPTATINLRPDVAVTRLSTEEHPQLGLVTNSSAPAFGEKHQDPSVPVTTLASSIHGTNATLTKVPASETTTFDKAKVDVALDTSGGSKNSQSPSTTEPSATTKKQSIFTIDQMQEQRAISFRFQFALNSARLTTEHKLKLDILGMALSHQSLADQVFFIVGHTDQSGRFEANIMLSQKRAQALVGYLANRFHIDAKRLIAVGKGSTELLDPVLPNAAVNRRVEIVAMRPMEIVALKQ